MDKTTIENYAFTDGIDENTRVLLERLKYDERFDNFDSNFRSPKKTLERHSYKTSIAKCEFKKINWTVIISFLLSQKEVSQIQSYYVGYYYQFIDINYELMKKYYLIAIEKGNTDAMVNLGNYYRDIEKISELMKKYYLMAIERGNDDALTDFGYYYHCININYDLMKKYYLMAIEKGNSTAMNNLACYYDIKYDSQNYYESSNYNYNMLTKYYLMAVEKGNSTAMYNLGHFYNSGYSIKYDLVKKYYLMASEKGNSYAMLDLGYYYLDHEKNHDEAKKYYLMAIEKGNVDAMISMGTYYERYDRNYEFMKKYYLMAINLKPSLFTVIFTYFGEYAEKKSKCVFPSDDILYNTNIFIRLIYSSSLFDTPAAKTCKIDIDIIKTLIEKTELGTTVNKMFYYYFIEKNEEQFNKCCKIAIDEKCDKVFYDLGKWNLDNENYDEMKRFYGEAIKLNNDNAMIELANYYKNIEHNHNEIKKYLLMAVEKGNRDAMNDLGHHYQYRENNYDEMKKYYEMAIERGNSNSMNNLGYYYQHIEKDFDKMIECYQKAMLYENKDVDDNIVSFLTDLKINNLTRTDILNKISDKINMTKILKRVYGLISHI
uniref:Uncharacterized protein n=1 Tax=viral metagenome TaxID=1070528 RepID=A0A6C0EEK6_9ZZZZ